MTKSPSDFLYTTLPAGTDFSREYLSLRDIDVVTPAWFYECLAERNRAVGIYPEVYTFQKQITAAQINDLQSGFEVHAPSGAPSSSNRYLWIAENVDVVSQPYSFYRYNDDMDLAQIHYDHEMTLYPFMTKTWMNDTNYLYASRAYDPYIGRVASGDPIKWDHILYGLRVPITMLRKYVTKIKDAGAQQVRSWSETHSADQGVNQTFANWVNENSIYCKYAYVYSTSGSPESPSVTYFGKCTQRVNSENRIYFSNAYAKNSLKKYVVFKVRERLLNWDNGSARKNLEGYVIVPIGVATDYIDASMLVVAARNAISVIGINESEISYNNPQWKSWQSQTVQYSDFIQVSLCGIFVEWLIRDRTAEYPPS